MPRVLITDITWASASIEESVLSAVGAELVLAPTGEEADLVKLARGADAILTCFARVTEAVIQAGERLQVIGRYGIGVDNIAVEEATRRLIPVTNVPVYCADEVAEHAIGMILSLVRGLHKYNAALRAGEWSVATGLPTRRLRGCTLGIVGFGHVGQAVAARATGLGLQVVVHAPRGAEPARQAGFEVLDLIELARRSDFVSVHVPLTAATRGMIGQEFLTAMPRTSYLVNTSRGAVIDQDALVDALGGGEIEGAGLDVFVPERLEPDHPLMRSDRVLATPHTAFFSEQSVADLARLAAENVAAIFTGRRPRAIVNPLVLDSERWSHLSP